MSNSSFTFTKKKEKSSKKDVIGTAAHYKGLKFQNLHHLTVYVIVLVSFTRNNMYTCIFMPLVPRSQLRLSKELV